MRKIWWTLIVIGLADIAFAQTPVLQLDQRPKVVISGDTLQFPWTGGFNSIIPVEFDFNGDAFRDLFLFDRVGNRISTFINDGTAGIGAYHYAPEYISQLPPMHDWVRSVDYDCDGDLDLFTYTNSAMGVWRNDYTVGSGLQFTLVNAQLNSWYGSFYNAIFVSQVNMPAIVDVDGDGDMDILTFANSSNYLEYHKNYAMDSLGICDGFNFRLEPYCWGNFKLSGLTNIGLLGQNCRSNLAGDDVESLRSRHSGSVLTPLDQDCDGDVDLLNGDILGQNMLYLLNGGAPDSAVITAQDSAFPVYDVQVNMQNLPAAYYLDVDNDGAKDMIVSPYATVGEDFNNIHYYKNTTNNCTNVFDFIKSRFLSDETIDVGTAADVSIFDVDKDGLLDIIAGNDLYFSTNPATAYSRLAYFKNLGTITNPVFSLISDDWLGLSSITQYGLYPTFGDLDGDGDDDLLLGNSDGSLIYYQNTAGPGLPCNFVFASPQYQGIDIGNNSAPQIIDVNRDGKIDLLVGERNGVLNYFENTGSSVNPVFTLISSNFGGVSVLQAGAIAGYSTPLLFDNGSGYELLVGSDQGRIYHYTNIDGNLSGNFTLADTMYQNIQELKRITLAMGDLDGDSKFDLLAGCNAGGMRFYSQQANSGIAGVTSRSAFTLYPNPASNCVRIKLNDQVNPVKGTITVLDLLGREIMKSEINTQFVQLNTSRLTSGMYVVCLTVNGRTEVQKLNIK